MPRVSVVIPTWNRREFVTEAVKSALEQSHMPLEVIVVDDASTDGTPEALEREFGTCIRLEVLSANRGRSFARNHGWSIAAGDLVAFLDSDDTWLPQKLERQTPLFDDPAVVLVHGFVGKIDADGRRLETDTRTEERVFRRALARGYSYGTITETWCRMYTSAVIVRRAALERTGGFDSELHAFEDWDLFWRIARTGSVGTCPATVVLHRVHAGNTFESWRMAAQPWLRVARKHLGEIQGLPPSDELRRARRNLLVNLAIGEYWAGDHAASRGSMRETVRQYPLLLARPFHPHWGAPLLQAFLPRRAVRLMARLARYELYDDVGSEAG